MYLSFPAGIHTLTSPNQQVFDYVNVSKTTADATPKWYAGSHSTDGGTNTNIIFTDVPVPPVATAPGAGGIQAMSNVLNLLRL